MPIYVPRELFHAQGVLPVGVLGGGDDLEIIKPPDRQQRRTGTQELTAGLKALEDHAPQVEDDGL